MIVTFCNITFNRKEKAMGKKTYGKPKPPKK